MILPPAVILAGGRASRMGGGDKVLLELQGKPLLGHVIERLRPQVGAIAISANGDPARFAGFGLRVLPDEMPDHPGPLAGILAGMDWAAGLGAKVVISAAGDTPFLPPDLVRRLQDAAGPTGLAIAADGEAPDLHPTFGLWPVTLRDALRDALMSGERRIRAFAAANGAQIARFDGSAQAFFNINRPEDLARAAAGLR